MRHPAWRAWRAGDIDGAEHLAASAPDRTRVRLEFLTRFVRGRYREALDGYAADRTRFSRAFDEPVALAWLHSGRPDEALDHVIRRRGARAVPADLRMRVDQPLRTSLSVETVLPFAQGSLSPYLPAVETVMDGRPVVAHLDTGGTFVVMGTARAESLGVQLVPLGRDHHGTTRTSVSAGTLAELLLGDAVLTNVPVHVMPTLRGDQDVVLLGTNVFQQFLTTIDAPGERLVLAPRGSTVQPGVSATRIPFFLWGDHYMFARGGFGTRRDLSFFVDSGLAYVVREDDAAPARQASLYVTRRQSRSWGVDRRRASAPHWYAEEPIHLGDLRQDRALVATTPTRRTPWRSFGGVRIHALLSQGFLRDYSWTLDFDQHLYVFQPRDEAPAARAVGAPSIT